jgi:nucleotide-binding universal stress UspA family protein
MDPVTNAEILARPVAGVRIERILCPVDFSEVSVNAYRHAQSIASRYRAKLVALNAVEMWQHPSGDYAISADTYAGFRQALLSKAENDLHLFVETCGGLQPECIVRESVAADAILEQAKARAISLIVLGTHGRRGFDHLMLGSVAERVLRHASCPVLAVRQTADSSNPGAAEPILIRRILCCVDFSAHSRRALDYALSAADAYDAELSVLHVLDKVSDSADVAQETDAAMECLEKLLSPAAPRSPRIHLEVRLGKAYQEILKFASEMQSDLIVTGVRGRNSLDLAVFGSTTYRVIQLGPGPVLTVPI